MAIEVPYAIFLCKFSLSNFVALFDIFLAKFGKIVQIESDKECIFNLKKKVYFTFGLVECEIII